MRLFSRLRDNKILLSQFLLVFTAFFIMVLLGGHFGSRIVNKHIANYGDEVTIAMSETIKSYLKVYELTLDNIAFVLEGLRTQRSGVASKQEVLALWSDWMYANGGKYSEFLFLYGVVDGTFIRSDDWNYPNSYPPQSRVWHTGAYIKKGEVYYSAPYLDAHTGERVLTLSRLIFDENGQSFGVIALDVRISGIAAYITEMQLMNSGYGVLMDANRRILVHPMPELFGVQLENISGGIGYADIAGLLIEGEEVSAYNFTSVLGINSVAFAKELFNGWYIALSLPGDVYYSDTVVMHIVLSVTGLVLALLLCGVLTFLHIAKRRSDTASQGKSSFLANMSHEIRTPMNAVIGMTELLLHEQLTERQRDYVNDINASTHSLLALINDILDLSKIESGKLSLNYIDYDFHAMIDNISSMFKFVAQKKGLEFRFESVGEIPKILYGDDVRLRQVLTNLCGNAVKYTEKGYVRLKATTSDDLIILEVKDTGIGIQKEAMPRIFSAFEQDKSEKNRKIVGTGLGLAISKAFVEMMDGNIVLDSEFGQGTIVTVMIPLIPGSGSGVKREYAEKKDLNIYAPSARILIVDDNEFNIKVAHGLLMLFSIDAKAAFSGKGAIEMVKSDDYHIVFMDHMMPEMDGVEATLEIRKLGGKYKQLPIVALTANAVHGAREMFLANGFNDFISKPIDMQRLSEVLIQWLPHDIIMQNSGLRESVNPQDVIQNSIWDAIDGTGEINTEIGLRNASGVASIYLENLLLFHKSIVPECERLTTYIADVDIGGFSISIHAMKSVLSTIGAMRLSTDALKMETASKDREIIYCVENFPYFKEELISLHNALSAILPEDTPKSEKEVGDPDYLNDCIQKALTAADDFDYDIGLEAVNSLLEYDFGHKTNALLESALTAFMKYDFDKAAEDLKKVHG